MATHTLHSLVGQTQFFNISMWVFLLFFSPSDSWCLCSPGCVYWCEHANAGQGLQRRPLVQTQTVSYQQTPRAWPGNVHHLSERYQHTAVLHTDSAPFNYFTRNTTSTNVSTLDMKHCIAHDEQLAPWMAAFAIRVGMCKSAVKALWVLGQPEIPAFTVIPPETTNYQFYHQKCQLLCQIGSMIFCR